MTATASTSALESAAARLPGPAHKDGNVLRWLAAYTASMLGDGIYFLALGFAAAKAAPPAEAGLVMAAGSVPRAALMLGGGVIADRFGPRRVVIGSDAVRCVLILAAALGLGTGVLCGICGGLATALIQSATEPGYLGRVTSVMSLTGFGLAPLAYPVFGAAVAAWGPSPVFLASAGLGAVGGVVGLAAPAVRTAQLSNPAAQPR